MFPDMDICNDCNHVRYHSVELFKQGWLLILVTVSGPILFVLETGNILLLL